MILLTCKTLRETRLRIKAVRDITLTLTLMPRNKSRGTKSRGAICFLSADNARNFYQLSISQFEIIAV